MIRAALAGCLLVLGCVGGTAHAQTVTAADPEAMADVMRAAGYEATVGLDNVGDPKIDTELNGWKTIILFYGCDELTKTNCDAIQLSTGFDRETPMAPEQALSIARSYRFLSVWLDEEGDPFLDWDILTLDGLPQSIFLRSLREYGEVLDSAAEIIFEDEM